MKDLDNLPFLQNGTSDIDNRAYQRGLAFFDGFIGCLRWRRFLLKRFIFEPTVVWVSLPWQRSDYGQGVAEATRRRVSERGCVVLHTSELLMFSIEPIPCVLVIDKSKN